MEGRGGERREGRAALLPRVVPPPVNARAETARHLSLSLFFSLSGLSKQEWQKGEGGGLVA